MKLSAFLQAVDSHDSYAAPERHQRVYRYLVSGGPEGLPLGLAAIVRSAQGYSPRKHFVLTNLSPCCEASWLLAPIESQAAWVCWSCSREYPFTEDGAHTQVQVLAASAHEREWATEWSFPLFERDELAPVDARLLEWLTFSGVYPAEETALELAQAAGELARVIYAELPSGPLPLMLS